MDREGARRVGEALMLDPSALTMDVSPPDGRSFWLYESMLPSDRRGQIKPTFRISEVAQFFFARSPDWMRWLGNLHDREAPIFELDGQPLEIKRTESGNRVYNLVDVERLAHALIQHGKIDGQQFMITINLVRWVAVGYRILTVEDLVPHGTPPVSLTQPPIDGIDEQIAQADRSLYEA